MNDYGPTKNLLAIHVGSKPVEFYRLLSRQGTKYATKVSHFKLVVRTLSSSWGASDIERVEVTSSRVAVSVADWISMNMITAC
jgi:hypothetical protein